MLTHYTRTPDAVGKILTHGFAWIPNRRHLTDVLLPEHDYSEREPQQFGMISFTDLEPEHAGPHRDAFGTFGIVVSDRWAARHDAQRVLYVDKQGPVTDALRAVFAIGYDDVTERIPYLDDAGWLMAYENKRAAGAIAGSRLWASLLQLWEYLEPASQADQREWRIVNPGPDYGLSEDKAEAIARVSPPRGWAQILHVVPVPRDDVIALVCAAGDRQTLEAHVPDAFSDVPFVEVSASRPTDGPDMGRGDGSPI